MLSKSDQHLHVDAPIPSPCMSLQSLVQPTEKAPDPTFVHLPLQLLVVPILSRQPMSMLFPLSSCLTFVLILASSSLLVPSSSTLVLPSTSTMSHVALVLLPATSIFLSSSTLLSASFAYVAKVSFLKRGSTFILHLCSPSGLSVIFIFPLPCRGLLPYVVVSFGVIVIYGVACEVPTKLTGSLSLEAL